MANLKTEQTLCNILIAGKTGAGKSVLLNAMFGAKLARTNVGRPVTADIVRYDLAPDGRLTVFDTPGLRTYQETNSEIQQHIRGLIKYFSLREADEPIHVVWYCINARGHRIENSEIAWITELANSGLAVILVLTQFFKHTDDNFVTYIKQLDLPVREIIPVLAAPFEIAAHIVLPVHGLEHLAKTTALVLPQSAQLIFLQAQQVDQHLMEYFAPREWGI